LEKIKNKMAKEKKITKVMTRRRKFQKVDIPLIRSEIELIGSSPEEVDQRRIKLDLTRQLKGKSVEATVKIKIENNKPIAHPIKIRLLPYFIRRMIRKRISYVEDSFETPSQESMLRVKPFLITRKRVSRVVRKTLRNKCKNWLEDHIAEKNDSEIFSEILTNKLQKPLSLSLKKTYPLSLCEIRVLEIVRPLNPEEIPKIKKKAIVEEEEEIIDQIGEIEKEKIKQAEKNIKKAQEKAIEKETSEKPEETEEKTKPKEKKESKTTESKDSAKNQSSD